jgi:hypothetical protein
MPEGFVRWGITMSDRYVPPYIAPAVEMTRHAVFLQSQPTAEQGAAGRFLGK